LEMMKHLKERDRKGDHKSGVAESSILTCKILFYIVWLIITRLK
jgi:hypothetical protein